MTWARTPKGKTIRFMSNHEIAGRMLVRPRLPVTVNRYSLDSAVRRQVRRLNAGNLRTVPVSARPRGPAGLADTKASANRYADLAEQEHRSHTVNK